MRGSRIIGWSTQRQGADLAEEIRMSSDKHHFVACAKRGDPEAFTQLEKQYRAPLTSYCRKFVQDVAEDVVQEAFLRVWGSIRTLKGDTEVEFKAWLYQIARNLCIDVFHRRTREAAANDVFIDTHADASSMEEEALSHCFAQEVLKQAASILEERDWHICIWYYTEEMESQEIANRLPLKWKLSAAGVRSCLKRRIRPTIENILIGMEHGGTVSATGDNSNPVYNKIVSQEERK
jgi:RNA polymerase sigma factor (sigma-70 family)